MAGGLLTYLGFGPPSGKPAVKDVVPRRPQDVAPPWTSHLRVVGEALAHHDAKAAMRALEDADACALASGQWAAMVEVGDAHLRVAETARARKTLIARAHQNYLAALYCARQQRSVEGVLRTAAGFAGLGDRESVDQCLLIAKSMASAAHDDGARARVRRVAAHAESPHPAAV
jgi:hypothetical protein